MSELRICLVSSEVAPFAKTGGLADVAAGLGRHLAASGQDVRLFMPMYSRIDPSHYEFVDEPALQSIEIGAGSSRVKFAVRKTFLPGAERLPVYCVDCPELFHREEFYGSYADEHVRFALLNRAVIEACQRLQWVPHVFHCNDWHTALLPLYLRTLYGWDRMFRPTRTLLTIHNIGFQGVFPTSVLGDVGLAEQAHLFHQDDFRAGTVNFLKTGVLYADWLTTVSATYAHEIQTPELGMGLEEVLRQRRSSLTGIVNGVDYGHWNPAVDPLIPHHYDAEDLSGKARDKAALIARFGLQLDERAPLLGCVSRLTTQKGFDLLLDVLPGLLEHGQLGIVVLGSGEQHYESAFQRLRDAFPAKVGFYRGYHEELAHWIEAGADLFLMPSRYEPCGLNQMYSLKYGTPPLVRKTGGLADTVERFDPATGRGTGFVFERYDSNALAGELRRALGVWQDRAAWSRLVRNGMAQDFSWEKQGEPYLRLYRGLAGSA